MPSPQATPTIDPFRQGFVGYVHIDGLQWRVILRLRLEDEAWWRGRLWFAEAGGTEVWDKEEVFGRSPEELLRHARVLTAAQLIRRFRDSFEERRRYFALRALLDDMLEKARVLNRVAVRAASRELEASKAQSELDRIQREMTTLVAGMREVAATEGRLGG